MNINFKNINAKNFKSYEELYIDIERGFTAIQGINNNPEDNAKSNGVGKSTIFDAICWALTGKTISGSKSVENIYLEGTTISEVTFDVDGVEYIVSRTKNPSNLKVFVDGEDVSGKGIKDTEKILAERLPEVTYNLITSVIILGQGLPNRFSSNTPSGRKEVLEKLSHTDFMIEDIKNRVADRLMELGDDIQTCTMDITKEESAMSFYKEQIESLENELGVLNSADIESIKNDRDYARSMVYGFEKKLEEAQEKLDDCVKTYSKCDDEYKAMLKNRNVRVCNISLPCDTTEIESNLATLKETLSADKKELEMSENITDVCPTCGQKIDGITLPDTTPIKERIKDAENKIKVITIERDRLKQENEQYYIIEVGKIDADVNKAEEFYNNANEELKKCKETVKSIEESLNSYRKKFEEAESYLTSYDANVERINKDVSDYQSNVYECSDRLNVLMDRNDELKDRNACVTKINTLIKRDFRGYLLADVIKFVDQKSKYNSMEVFGNDCISVELDGNNIAIRFAERDYESLSGGEKQKVDLCVQLAIRDMLCSFLSFSCNVLVLDEITDNIDSDGAERVFNLISKINDVDSIYLITHHSDYDIPVDNEINIVKGDDRISRIV